MNVGAHCPTSKQIKRLDSGREREVPRLDADLVASRREPQS